MLHVRITDLLKIVKSFNLGINNFYHFFVLFLVLEVMHWPSASIDSFRNDCLVFLPSLPPSDIYLAFIVCS